MSGCDIVCGLGSLNGHNFRFLLRLCLASFQVATSFYVLKLLMWFQLHLLAKTSLVAFIDGSTSRHWSNVVTSIVLSRCHDPQSGVAT